MAVTEEQVRHAQAHAVGLLNEAERVLTGWVLGHDKEAIEKLTSPLHDLLDNDPPSVKKTVDV